MVDLRDDKSAWVLSPSQMCFAHRDTHSLKFTYLRYKILRIPLSYTTDLDQNTALNVQPYNVIIVICAVYTML